MAEALLEKINYRDRIMKAVQDDREHPVNNGVKMQAHHLLSAKGVQLASLGADLKQLGYDINVLENLVLLPYTLQAACHMQVQLHRGDHKDSDKDHPFTYHERVKIELVKLEKFIDSCKGCGSAAQAEINRKRIQAKLDQKSKILLLLIEKHKVRLTSISRDFKKDGIGCGGRNSVGERAMDGCPHSRDHANDHDAGFSGAIPRNYKLKVGQ